VGSRRGTRDSTPAFKYWANRFGDFWISWAAGAYLEDSHSGVRLYPSAVLRSLQVPLGDGRGFVYEIEILILAARAGIGISHVPISISYPADYWHQTRYHPVHDTARIVRLVAGKLASRGMDPLALMRFLRSRRRMTRQRDSAHT
jgi:hypothetical protein